jgi:hypothetical protein
MRKGTGAAGLEPATPGFGDLCSYSSHAGFRCLRTSLSTSWERHDLARDGAGEVLVQASCVFGQLALELVAVAVRNRGIRVTNVAIGPRLGDACRVEVGRVRMAALVQSDPLELSRLPGLVRAIADE